MPESTYELDPLLHAPVRLRIVTILADSTDADFVHLRDATGTTDGNLSRHLAKLEDAGYVKITKGYAGKKPRTSCSLTKRGRRALVGYLEELERIVELARRTTKED